MFCDSRNRIHILTKTRVFKKKFLTFCIVYSRVQATGFSFHIFISERLLAASNPLTQTDRPHQLFADAPRTTSHMHDAPNRPPPGMHNVLPPPIVPPPMGMMPPMGMPGMNPGMYIKEI